jgi:hypothetical protein
MRFKVVERPPLRSLRDKETHQYKSVWYNYKGAMAYINQEKKRLNLK